jgi:hypothetical protein
MGDPAKVVGSKRLVVDVRVTDEDGVLIVA